MRDGDVVEKEGRRSWRKPQLASGVQALLPTGSASRHILVQLLDPAFRRYYLQHHSLVTTRPARKLHVVLDNATAQSVATYIFHSSRSPSEERVAIAGSWTA